MYVIEQERGRDGGKEKREIWREKRTCRVGQPRERERERERERKRENGLSPTRLR